MAFPRSDPPAAPFVLLVATLTVFVVVTGATGTATTESVPDTADRGSAGTAAAVEARVNVSGRVLEPDGGPAAGDLIEIEPGGRDVTTDADGEFSAGVAPNETYNVEFHQESHEGPRDGVADLYAVGRFDVGTADVDVGNVTVPGAGVLNVTVVDASGAPVENASVHIEHRNGDARARTGGATRADGRAGVGATIGVEVNGTVRVSVEGPDGGGYLPTVTDLTVTGDRHVTVVLEEGVEVTGVVEQFDGTPAADGRVKFHDVPADFVTRVGADSRGRFAAEVLKNRTYNVQYDQSPPARDGYVDVYAIPMIDVGTADVGMGTVVLPPGNVLNVTVVNGSGHPVEGAEVVLDHRNGEAWSTAVRTTDAAGRMVDPDSGLAGIEVNGTVDVRAEPPDGSGLRANRTEIEVRDDAHVRLVLEERVSVNGTLLEADGAAAADDFVTANPVDTDEFTGIVLGRTRSDGSFDLPVEADRTYDVRAFQFDEAAGHLGQRDGTVDVYAVDRRAFGADADLGTVSLPAGHVLDVTVVDGSGDPVANASVNVTHTNDTTGARAVLVSNPTGDDGRMVAKAIPGLGVDRSDVAGLELRGNVTVEVRPPAASGFAPRAYTRTVAVTSDTNLTVTLEGRDGQAPDPVCGRCEVPTDADGDGRYEDVNGNGRPDFDDVVTFFERLDARAIRDQVAAFDFNANGRIDYDDVVALFEEI